MAVVLARLRNYFIAGLAVFTPLVLTVWILWMGFSFFDGILKPIVRPVITPILGREIPGLSLLLNILLLIVLGVFVTHALGRRVYNLFEKSLLRIPIISGIYSTAKEASNLFLSNKDKSFRAVVLVEFPKGGTYSLGFTTAATIEEIQDKTASEVINVYVPTTPNPTSGFLIMVPKSEVIPLDMSVEKAFKVILSGGLTKPKD
ncbi:MAG: DUF502 domain-containing protein [Euryarchaeota archaeon]|nr:DUF502 domain-containing protein [Euryarchaeota archaeon]